MSLLRERFALGLLVNGRSKGRPRPPAEGTRSPQRVKPGCLVEVRWNRLSSRVASLGIRIRVSDRRCSGIRATSCQWTRLRVSVALGADGTRVEVSPCRYPSTPRKRCGSGTTHRKEWSLSKQRMRSRSKRSRGWTCLSCLVGRAHSPSIACGGPGRRVSPPLTQHFVRGHRDGVREIQRTHRAWLLGQ